MATSHDDTIGALVKAAREAVGLSQQELADAVGIGRSSVAKLETGARKVTASELVRFAEVLNVSLDALVSPGPPAIVSRRNSRSPGSASPTIDREVERMARNVEFVQTHSAKLVIDSPDPLPYPKVQRDVEHNASLARNRLGLHDDSPVVDLVRLCADVGLLAFSVGLGTDSADGASTMIEHGGVAVVNGDLKVGRRRLTLAHELGHYLHGDEYSIDWPVQESQASGRETRIDHFARAFLLPAGGLAAAWRELESSQSLRGRAVLLASRYRVDMSTLARRLVDLKLVNRSDAEAVRSTRTTKADIVDFDLVVPQDLAPPALPQTFVQAVLDIYRQSIISGARALDLLLDTWDEADLPERPTLPENAIWSFVS